MTTPSGTAPDGTAPDRQVPRAPPPRGLVTAALRESAPRALSILANRLGDFDDAEDAVQDALAQAARQWSTNGIPDNPTGWVVTVAWRRAIDAIRADASRRERERRVFELDLTAAQPIHTDDTVALYLMCCHPALSRASQVALTLRAVAGLTTREIARGLLVSETTVAQRISRAKATLRRAGARFALPTEAEMPSRVAAVLDVLGIIHTEAHSAAGGDAITRPALGADATRLGRELLRRTDPASPWRGEIMGVVALMLLTDARAPARIGATGALVPLADQDRGLWHADLITEGDDLVSAALAGYPLGPFQLKAAIAAVHDRAASRAATDWRQILRLYDLLRIIDPSPIVELARLVPLAEAVGPALALRDLDDLSGSVPAGRAAAVRAYLLTLAGSDPSSAYREAAMSSGNGAERRWFEEMAARPLSADRQRAARST